MTFTLFELAERIGKNDLTITRAEAVMLPMIMKKNQVIEYSWDKNEVWIGMYNITLKIVENKKE